MESPLARRAVSGFFCSTVAEGAPRTWVSVREGERRPADSVDAFKSRPPAVGTKLSTGGGFLPADLIGKVAESSFTLDLGASVSAFPHLEPTATAWQGSGGVGDPR